MSSGSAIARSSACSYASRTAALLRGATRGRSYTEVPDITARICGICPVAYQTSGILAIEDACGVTVDGPIRGCAA